MSFRDVPGQKEASEFFRRAIDSGRLAHAYILIGPEGVGKRALAKAAAAYLFCSERGGDSCGKCRSCRMIASDQFGDLHRYLRPEGKAQLPVEVIEEFQRHVYLKPVESSHKVFILEEADKLNVAGANKLLKVLEEPPPESLILLLALDVRDFLPTILSRCHVVHLRPMPAEALAKELVSPSVTPEQARYLAAFTTGSPGLARQLATPEFFAERDWLIDLAAKLDRRTRFAAADEMFKRSGDKDDAAQGRREMLTRFLDVLALFYRDVLAASLGSDAGSSANADRAADVTALAGRLDAESLQGILGAIESAREAVAFNANQKLLLENLAFDIAKLQSP